MKKKVLFLCTGNSCRSQMAEGWARHLRSDEIEAFSAGVEKHGLNPYAVRVMKETGVDIATHQSKLLTDIPEKNFDLVITVCGNANERCPVFPDKTAVVHVPFDDPPALARGLTSEDEILSCYRKVRDQIKSFIENYAFTGGSMKEFSEDEIKQQVIKTYSKIATMGGSCCGESADSCCSPALGDPQISAKVGYSQEEIAKAPDGANMGLGCGNPSAIAELQAGEVVLDLGSGGGFDCFLAAGKVGRNGRVIGVDMTPDMLSKARRNAIAGKFVNVEFRLGEIEHLPVADNCVDVIISNCVINMSTQKQQVFSEAYRVLRAGGRLAISDVVALKPFAPEIIENSDAFCSCVSGAVSVDELKKMISQSGFSGISVELKTASKEYIKTWFPGAENFVVSAIIKAVK